MILITTPGFQQFQALNHQQLSGVVWTARGTSVFRIRTAVDFPPVLKSDHTMPSCSARRGPACFKPRRLGSDGPANVAGFANVGSMLRCNGRDLYGRPCSQNNQTHHTKSGLWLRSRCNRTSPTSSRGPAPASPHEASHISGRQKSLLS